MAIAREQIRMPEETKITPTISLIPKRREEVAVQAAGAQRETERRLYLTFHSAIELIFSSYLATNREINGTMLKNTISNISRDTFKGASVKYKHDENTKVYSVIATLDEKPVMLTLIIEKDLCQISVTDLKSGKIEALTEEKGKIDFGRGKMARV